MKTFLFGTSVLNQPIMAYQFGAPQKKQILILGGVHGDEWEGVYCAKALLSEFIKSYNLNLSVTLVPEFNPDGVLKNQRKNANNIDLNRNLPTKDWTSTVAEEKYAPGSQAGSEPENKALMKWLEMNHCDFIISLHSWKPLLNVNGDCEPIASVLARETLYEIHPSIGYPTPGCLGTFTGLEQNIPTLTYELERGMKSEPILETHVPAILKALKAFEFKIQENNL